MSRGSRLGAVFLVAGVLHLAWPRPFDRIVPRSLPGPPRAYTLLSGVAELGVAWLLDDARTRRLGGRLAAALLVAVFPANVSMALRSAASPRAGRLHTAVAVARLPLQAPLIRLALRESRRR